ncbi:WhiB-related protein [Bifidobacterium saguini DSM 23967]|uniref:WhiB-related protein n=2 Tax=Bifidobacterium saguini TaxID=762210 RepID=A0A087D247_9BIFI|nr:WhiB family transcriptional regulator [Bifidobacterium saguini]KFI89597.1 WhiB-related protein [Bifidobacterium saguini DSM 23967]QTB90698.1 WhiB family transcriptional regulator [Bifidobacterium saguini]
MTQTQTAVCTRIASRNAALADRLWGSVETDHGEEYDRKARAKGRELCASCPMLENCLAQALTGRWRDDRIVGGLTYRERRKLARCVGEGLDVPPRRLGHVHPNRVAAWIREHPQSIDIARDEQRSYWRRTKQANHESRPVGMPAQGTLF